MTTNLFHWSANDVLDSLRCLQENSSFTDVVFVCPDGTVEAHKAVLENHSALLKSFFRRKKGCCSNAPNADPSTTESCNYLEETVTLLLPDYSVSAVNFLLRILYTGQATIDSKQELDGLNHLCLNLMIKIPLKVIKSAGFGNVSSSSSPAAIPRKEMVPTPKVAKFPEVSLRSRGDSHNNSLVTVSCKKCGCDYPSLTLYYHHQLKICQEMAASAPTVLVEGGGSSRFVQAENVVMDHNNEEFLSEDPLEVNGFAEEADGIIRHGVVDKQVVRDVIRPSLFAKKKKETNVEERGDKDDDSPKSERYKEVFDSKGSVDDDNDGSHDESDNMPKIRKHSNKKTMSRRTRTEESEEDDDEGSEAHRYKTPKRDRRSRDYRESVDDRNDDDDASEDETENVVKARKTLSKSNKKINRTKFEERDDGEDSEGSEADRYKKPKREKRVLDYKKSVDVNDDEPDNAIKARKNSTPTKTGPKRTTKKTKREDDDESSEDDRSNGSKRGRRIRDYKESVDDTSDGEPDKVLKSTKNRKSSETGLIRRSTYKMSPTWGISDETDEEEDAKRAKRRRMVAKESVEDDDASGDEPLKTRKNGENGDVKMRNKARKEKDDDSDDIQTSQRSAKKSSSSSNSQVRPCPTCSKTVEGGSGRIREHVAVSHLIESLQMYVREEDGESCKLCSYAGPTNLVARHAGLVHSGVEEFADAEQMRWINWATKFYKK